jgi:hypothetical protein
MNTVYYSPIFKSNCIKSGFVFKSKSTDLNNSQPFLVFNKLNSILFNYLDQNNNFVDQSFEIRVFANIHSLYRIQSSNLTVSSDFIVILTEDL